MPIGTHSVCVCLHACVCSVISDRLWPHGLYPARFLCPWNFPGKNPGAGFHFLFNGIFLNQNQTWVTHVSCTAAPHGKPQYTLFSSISIYPLSVTIFNLIYLSNVLTVTLVGCFFVCFCIITIPLLNIIPS